MILIFLLEALISRSSIISSVNLIISNEDVNKNSTLTTDYLKKIPANDYILGPGDELKISYRDVPELDDLNLVGGVQALRGQLSNKIQQATQSSIGVCVAWWV